MNIEIGNDISSELNLFFCRCARTICYVTASHIFFVSLFASPFVCIIIMYPFDLIVSL